MTDHLTDASVKALLDGATPGPWRADGEPWNRIVWSSAENRVCFMAHSSGLNDERDIATSNLAAAAPELARALLAARADTEAAVALALEEAAAQADPWDGPVTKNKTVDAQAIAAQQIKARIRRLAPASGVAKLEEFRAERDEWKRLAVAGEITARHLTIVQTELAAANAREAGLREALTRQGDNMAFVLNHMTMPDGYYGKFIHELEEDRAALAQPSTEGGE